MRLEDRDFMAETVNALAGLEEKLRALEPASAQAVEDAINLLQEAEQHVRALAMPTRASAHSATRWLEAIRGAETMPSLAVARDATRTQIASGCLAAMLGASVHSQWQPGQNGATLADIACEYADSLMRQLDARFERDR